MDELTLLRNTRSETEPPQAALNRGRATLLERAAGEAVPAGAKTHPVRRRFAIGGLSTVGAAALVATLVLTDVVGLAGWRGGADAAAAAVLHEASAAAITSVDPVLADGQYLRVNTRAVYGSYGESGYFQRLIDDTLYRPADSGDDWVWVRGPQTVYATFGAESERLATEWARTKDEDDTFENGDLLRARAGAFYGGESMVGDESLAALPRDPYRLLNYIYRTTLGAGPSPDTEALVFIADRLRSGVVPADLRAAMYQAAALIPGVTFVDDQATLDGRNGVSIGRVEDAWGVRFEIIIDRTTGQLVGEREVATREDAANGIAAGDVLEWTAVTTDVVASAPEGGTPYGKMAPSGGVTAP